MHSPGRMALCATVYFEAWRQACHALCLLREAEMFMGWIFEISPSQKPRLCLSLLLERSRVPRPSAFPKLDTTKNSSRGGRDFRNFLPNQKPRPLSHTPRKKDGAPSVGIGKVQHRLDRRTGSPPRASEKHQGRNRWTSGPVLPTLACFVTFRSNPL